MGNLIILMLAAGGIGYLVGSRKKAGAEETAEVAS